MDWREVHLDFETASACDLKKAGAWVYAEDPTTEIICLSYSIDGGEPYLWLPGIATSWHLLELANDTRAFFIAHNAGFEKAIWRKIMVPVYGWPDVPNRRWHDTLAMCAMRCIPQDLGKAVDVLGLPFPKDMEGNRLTKSLSKPNKKGYYDRSPETLARVYTYCKQDVRAEVALHKRLGWMPAGERNVWLLDQRMNERGVGIDLAFVHAAQRVVARASGPLFHEFTKITGGLVPGQVKAVIEWAAGQGFAVPNLQKDTLSTLLGETDEGEEVDADEDLLSAEMPDNVRRALRIRQLVGSASIKKLARMVHCTGHDGRARGLLQYHGAGPGLWAGRLFQPQNFPRGTVKIDDQAPDPDLIVDAIMTGDPDYVETILGAPAIDVVVSGLRHAIVAAPGRVLVAGDLSGIQARLVLALAGQMDILDLMTKSDVYLYMAEDIFNAPHGTFDKKHNMEQRQYGKNTILGCGFQMGAAKFRQKYCPHQPLEFAQKIVDTYRKVTAPKVPQLWYALDEAACRTVWDRKPHEAYGIEYRLEDVWLTARLPSGRKIWYFGPEAVHRQVPWSDPEDPEFRPGWRYRARKLGQWRVIDAFGGLLTENVVMGMQRDLMVRAMLRCEDEGLPLILNVHDENVTEPKESGGLTTLRIALNEIMCDTPEWARSMKLPVASEVWVGGRYKK